MLTKRDKEITNFITAFKVANTSTIKRLFFSNLRTAQIRLKWLHDNKVIKRSREYVIKEYIYYLKKPKQFQHKLLLSDFYNRLNQMVDIKHFVVEKAVGSIIPDAIMAYEYKGNKYIGCIEIEISNNPISKKIDAYRKFYKTGQYKKYFNTMPTLILVTDKKVPKVEEFRVIQIHENFSNIDIICRR
ncbi:hypothetical protein [Inediibacterium massiliense]|uniref:hypothetical protein n=1 Tax=Inediibacterium massiliense TaxID=1658111 RepID=UPI0006B4611F|nr:hypothetical protein [Inediibacterium massiliense]